MTIKVTFSARDEVLAAIIRALAVKTAGFGAAKGQNDRTLQQHGCYHFEFSGDQLNQFRNMVDTYISEKFRKLIQISSSN